MSRINATLAACAALMGACGVVAAAGAAHAAGAEKLASVALILLVHAAALLALTLREGRLWLAAACVMIFGASLFSVDVSLSVLRGAHLFPFAAPIGGSSLILAWLLGFFAALAELKAKRAGTLP
jgi:uncharacterized membrane protein YgdD (TMEM256/DUF423 family)